MPENWYESFSCRSSCHCYQYCNHSYTWKSLLNLHCDDSNHENIEKFGFYRITTSWCQKKISYPRCLTYFAILYSLSVYKLTISKLALKNFCHSRKTTLLTELTIIFTVMYNFEIIRAHADSEGRRKAESAADTPYFNNGERDAIDVFLARFIRFRAG